MGITLMVVNIALCDRLHNVGWHTVAFQTWSVIGLTCNATLLIWNDTKLICNAAFLVWNVTEQIWNAAFQT